MKKIIFILFLLTFLSPKNSFCQPFNFGLKLGVQSAGILNNQFADGRIFDYSIYLFTDIQTSRLFSLVIDFGITQRGFKTTITERDILGNAVQNVTATSKLTYVSLTPFLNYNVPAGALTAYIGIAPRLDYLASKKRGEFDFTSGTYGLNLVDRLDKFALGASFVTGIKNIKLNSINLRIEGKYEIDITDSLSDYPAKFRNSVFMLVVGVGL